MFFRGFFHIFILSVKGLGLFTRHSRNAGNWVEADKVGILGVLGILGGCP